MSLLMNAIRNGVEATGPVTLPAFAEVVETNKAMVFSIAWHFLRDQALAEENQERLSSRYQFGVISMTFQQGQDVRQRFWSLIAGCACLAGRLLPGVYVHCRLPLSLGNSSRCVRLP